MIKDAAQQPTQTSHMQQIIGVFLRGLAGHQRDRARPEHQRCGNTEHHCLFDSVRSQKLINILGNSSPTVMDLQLW